MLSSVVGTLWLAAFIGTLVSAAGKCQLWVPVLLICIAGLLGLGYLPLR